MKLTIGQRWRGQPAWIWIQALADQPNQRLQARRAFDLARIPRRAGLAISCAHIYRLYVNGQLVGRGPDRSADRLPYCDHHDVTNLLKVGVNVVAVLAHHVGQKLAGRVWPLYDGPPGLLLQLDLGEQVLVSDGSWQLRPDPAHLPSPRTVHAFRGFKEYVDGSKLDAGWRVAPDGGDDWRQADVVAPLVGGFWDPPRPREIPPLVTHRRGPVDAWAKQSQANAVFNLYRLLSERHARRGPTKVHLREPGESASIDVDLGRCMAGFPHLALSNCRGGQVDLFVGDTFHRFHEARILLPAGGEVEWTGLDWRGGRFMSLEFSGFLGEMNVDRVAFDECVYPFEDRGRFDCDDSTINRIWSACRLTAANCVMDHPSADTGREQAIWFGDLIVHGRALLACFGDARPLFKAVRQAFAVQRPDGMLPIPGPGDRGYGEDEGESGHVPGGLLWVDHAMAVLLVLRDTVLASGELECARQLLPQAVKFLGFLETLCNPAQMIENNPRHPLVMHLGWSPFFNLGLAHDEAGVWEILGAQAMRVRALDSAADLAAWCGQAAVARSLTEQAATLRRAIHERYFDADAGLYRDGFHAGQPVPRFSQVLNAHALLADVAPEPVRQRCLDQMLSDPRAIASTCPYDTSLIAEALFLGGRVREAMSLIRDHLGQIVVGENHLQIVEYFDRSLVGGDRYRHPDWSRCHPFGAGPAYLLAEHVLGVTPLEPGFGRVAWRPNLAGLGRAQATVPLPGGRHLHASIDAGKAQLSTDAPLRVEARCGDVTRSWQGPGTLSLSYQGS
jgi:hypothetical protein